MKMRFLGSKLMCLGVLMIGLKYYFVCLWDWFSIFRKGNRSWNSVDWLRESGEGRWEHSLNFLLKKKIILLCHCKLRIVQKFHLITLNIALSNGSKSLSSLAILSLKKVSHISEIWQNSKIISKLNVLKNHLNLGYKFQK